MGIGVGAAVLGAGVLGAGASVAGGIMQSNAASQAANTNLAMYNQTRQDLLPYMNAGTGALSQLQTMLGLGTGGMGSALSTLQNTPGYQWAFGQGLQATNQSLAAQGLNLSGGQLSALTQYGQGMASQTYNNYVGQLQSLAGLGESAGAQTGVQGTQAAAQAGQAQYASGVASASGLTGATNNLGGSLIANSLLPYVLNNGGSYGQSAIQPVAIQSAIQPVAITPNVYGDYSSDRRLKKNIKRIGMLDSGLPVYSYEYKGSSLPQIGVMAQDVEKVAPHAVTRDRAGYRRVNYRVVSQLPSIRKAA